MRSFASIDEFRRFIYEQADLAYKGHNLGLPKLKQDYGSKPRWFLNKDRFGYKEIVLYANSQIPKEIIDVVIKTTQERLSSSGLFGFEITNKGPHLSDQTISQYLLTGKINSASVHQKAVHDQAFIARTETDQKGIIMVTSKEDFDNHGSFGSASFRTGVMILNLGSSHLPERQNFDNKVYKNLPEDKRRQIEECVKNITPHLSGLFSGMFCGCEELSLPCLEETKLKQEMCNMHSQCYCVKRCTCRKCNYFLKTWWEAIMSSK